MSLNQPGKGTAVDETAEGMNKVEPKAMDCSKDAAGKTVGGAKGAGNKSAQGARKVAKKTAEGAKNTEKALKTVLPRERHALVLLEAAMPSAATNVR